MKTTLIIMAGGAGRRFGGEIKALASVGPNGECIMEYSVHDAIKAGYNQILFVVNKNIESNFLDVFGTTAFSVCNKHNVECHYVLELVADVPHNVVYPTTRQDPWGTGQAVLACKEYLSGPFAVINADDFYGYEALRTMKMHLCKDTQTQYYMTGYRIINTLPNTGNVNRGICKIEGDQIIDIQETPNIRLEPSTEKAGHQICTDKRIIPDDSFVNMNLWGFPLSFIKVLEIEFQNFFIEKKEHLENAEFLLPVIMGKLVRQKHLCLNLIRSEEKCFGLTRQSDLYNVRKKIASLVESGEYSSNLYSDL